jgi:three-Cys-motif partner protein
MVIHSEIPWLNRRLAKLLMTKDQIGSLAKIKEGIYNPIRSWSPLKLVFLHYVASIYTTIIAKQKKLFPNMYYIDLFSGSGIDKIEDTGDLCLGSPLLIATQIKQKQFNKMFFCENNQEFSKALGLRLERIIDKEKFKIFQKDCNLAIDDILSELKQPCHSLIFIDPYCMGISWKTMEKILRLNADIIFIFQTVENPRGKKGKSFKEFFKNSEKALEICEKTSEGKIREALLNLYISDIIETRKPKKTICETIRIQGEKFYYDVLFITKETRKGNPWMKGIISAKKEIEKNTSIAVKRTLDVLTGRQTTLGKY